MIIVIWRKFFKEKEKTTLKMKVNQDHLEQH